MNEAFAGLAEPGKGRRAYGDGARDVMLAENVAGDDPSLLRVGEIGHAAREDCVAVVRLAIRGEEAYETLEANST